MTTVPGPSLAAFFDAMKGYLWDERPIDAVLQELGPSPSTPARFGFYRSLVNRNPRRPVSSNFRACGALLDAAEAGLFDRAVEAHLAALPDRACSLLRLAPGFSATLERLAEEGAPVSSQALEVADYEEVRHRLSFLDVGAGESGKPHPSVEVRSYTFDVPGFCKRVRADPETKPSGDAITRIIFRSPTTGKIEFLSPDMPMLVALAIASGEADESVVEQAQLTREQVAEARNVLTERGVLCP